MRVQWMSNSERTVHGRNIPVDAGEPRSRDMMSIRHGGNSRIRGNETMAQANSRAGKGVSPRMREDNIIETGRPRTWGESPQLREVFLVIQSSCN